jgi:hypothetical protein
MVSLNAPTHSHNKSSVAPHVILSEAKDLATSVEAFPILARSFGCASG